MPHPPVLWFIATRPSFLAVTFVGVLLGLACAVHDQAFRSILLAVMTMTFALIGHAGANVINDYYDARNGCDDANIDRISPFTGGSRFIQNRLLSERQTWFFGYGLLASVIPVGIWLLNQSGLELLWIGLIGLFSAWAYSATPFKLQSRGLGELTIIAAWLMVVIGSDYVQSQSLSSSALYAGLAYAVLVANVLFINQVPDRIADAAVAKGTLIVRWGTCIAPWGSLALVTLSCTVLISGIASQNLPISAGWALVGITPITIALYLLFKNPTDPKQLRVAILGTISGCLLYGLLLSAALAV